MATRGLGARGGGAQAGRVREPPPQVAGPDADVLARALFKVPLEVPPHSWLKRRMGAPPNRYGIRPGRHWRARCDAPPCAAVGRRVRRQARLGGCAAQGRRGPQQRLRGAGARAGAHRRRGAQQRCKRQAVPRCVCVARPQVFKMKNEQATNKRDSWLFMQSIYE